MARKIAEKVAMNDILKNGPQWLKKRQLPRKPLKTRNKKNQYGFPDGKWKCTCCGEIYDPENIQKSTGSWRSVDGYMEHKCPGNIPQAGHFIAEKIG